MVHAVGVRGMTAGVGWTQTYGEPPSRLSIAMTEIAMPDDWRMRMDPGHIEGVAETAKWGQRWYGRWLEVTRLGDFVIRSARRPLRLEAASPRTRPDLVGRHGRIETAYAGLAAKG